MPQRTRGWLKFPPQETNQQEARGTWLKFPPRDEMHQLTGEFATKRPEISSIFVVSPATREFAPLRG
ncbi:MAG TPA: hypothetical protein VES36_11115 [Candidatus Limnocylindrales bacterium]|nr:hypothetical protein [Candidatus Limnocylindrales bacterium]